MTHARLFIFPLLALMTDGTLLCLAAVAQIVGYDTLVARLLLAGFAASLLFGLLTRHLIDGRNAISKTDVSDDYELLLGCWAIVTAIGWTYFLFRTIEFFPAALTVALFLGMIRYWLLQQLRTAWNLHNFDLTTNGRYR